MQRMGDVLLEATDLQDLRDRAGDQAARMPLVFAPDDVADLASKLDTMKDLDLADAGFDRVLGEGPCATATTAVRMLVEVLRIWVTGGYLAAIAQQPPPPANGLEELAYDVSVPAEHRHAIWRMALMGPASYAMGRALERDIRLERWLAKALSDMLAEGVRALASMVSLRAADAGPTLRHELVAEWCREARARGLDVYFPLGDPDARTR